MKPDDLSLMLGEMRSDIKAILRHIDIMGKWQELHESNDNTRIDLLNKKIDTKTEELDTRITKLNRFAASVAIISGAVGFGFKYMIDHL